MLDSLSKMGINLNYLKGQGYNGAGAMSGRLRGLQAKISEKYPSAIYVHCASLPLN